LRPNSICIEYISSPPRCERGVGEGIGGSRISYAQTTSGGSKRTAVVILCVSNGADLSFP
jgi:hypothetical protein